MDDAKSLIAHHPAVRHLKKHESVIPRDWDTLPVLASSASIAFGGLSNQTYLDYTEPVALGRVTTVFQRLLRIPTSALSSYVCAHLSGQAHCLCLRSSARPLCRLR